MIPACKTTSVNWCTQRYSVEQASTGICLKDAKSLVTGAWTQLNVRTPDPQKSMVLRYQKDLRESASVSNLCQDERTCCLVGLIGKQKYFFSAVTESF